MSEWVAWQTCPPSSPQRASASAASDAGVLAGADRGMMTRPSGGGGTRREMIGGTAILALGCALAHAEGPLEGLVVYLSAGHGYVAHDRGEGWQRPESNGLLEDLWTARFATGELIPALEGAGAVVLTPRERDPHRERVVVDDRDPGFHGAGRRDGEHVLVEDTARWTLAAPHAGTWQLYARWQAHPDLADATYAIHTPTGTYTRRVDQRHHAGEWWPLVRLDLDGGDWVQVTLDGDALASADAVRLGGGTYDIPHKDGTSRTVRAWEAAAIHHLQEEGAPEQVWSGGGSGLGGDASARARWASWSYPEGTEAVYLSIHTDAGGGSGTTAFVRQRCSDCGGRAQASTELADALRESLVAGVRADHEPEWRDRGTRAARLAEVSDELNPGIPAVLIEVGFHDHRGDASLLAASAFQATAADAIVQGLARWRDPNSVNAPLPVRSVTWRDQELTWAPGDDLLQGEPTIWRVRTRRGAASWTLLGSTTIPAWRVPEGTFEVEITPTRAGWYGRPVRVALEDATAAEGSFDGHGPSR